MEDGDEIAATTNPLDPDSDDDDLLDGFEVQYGFDPLTGGEQNENPDIDGLTNLAEQSAGTNPTLADSDNDGLDDGDEVNTWLTDPLNPDSDSDGLLDGFEANNGFDPLLTGEEDEDPDNDGLDNLAEQEYSTAPLDPDSDDDGLLDGFEVFYGFNPLVGGEQSLDPDADGLNNLEEQTFNTNPLEGDSDGDGFTDGDEVNLYGTDPTKPYINISDGTGISDHAMVVSDNSGNVHLVWEDNRSGNFEIYYAMHSPFGRTLINDTRLTDDNADSRRPALALNSLGQVHVVWQDDRSGITEVYHTLIDPAQDDRDGSSAAVGEITLLASHILSSDDDVEDTNPRLTIDSQDRVHMVWNDWPCTDTGEGIICAPNEIHYLRLDSNGAADIGPRTIFNQFSWEGAQIPAVTIDYQDNPHIAFVWDYNTLYYMMLDGSTGDTLVDRTSFPSGVKPGYISILVNADNSCLMVYEDQANWDADSELYLTAFNPYLDDRNGDGAELNIITTLAATAITADTAVSAVRPAAALDQEGNIHIGYLSEYTGWPVAGNLMYRTVDQAGVTLHEEELLTGSPSATSADEPSFPSVAIGNNGTFVTWTDAQSGQPQVLLKVLLPDQP